MTIEILRPGATKPGISRTEITFEEIQRLVGGYVELNHVGHEQVCCNEEGLIHGLPHNALATARYAGKLNMGPGAVGVWVILTGKDKLR